MNKKNELLVAINEETFEKFQKTENIDIQKEILKSFFSEVISIVKEYI